MERAIKSLASIPDAKLFEEVATGIEHVVDLVTRLDGAAHGLSESEQHHPARILGNLAEEEASKVLILVDAVRCPRQKQADKSRTLGYLYEHLAKGIYAQVCDWRPVNVDDIAQGIDDRSIKRRRLLFALCSFPNPV